MHSNELGTFSLRIDDGQMKVLEELRDLLKSFLITEQRMLALTEERKEYLDGLAKLGEESTQAEK